MFQNRKAQRFIRWMCFVGVIFCSAGMFAQHSLKATAATTTYNVWVDGIQVTSANAKDITGKGTAVYDATDNKIKLSNYNGGAIKSESDLKIYIFPDTTSTITSPDSVGIEVTNGKLVLDGEGNLKITAKKNAGIKTYGECGLWGDVNVTIDAKAGMTSTNGDVVIWNYNCKTNIKATGLNGLRANNGNVKIVNKGELTIIAYNKGIYAPNGKVTFWGEGDTLIRASESNAIHCNQDVEMSNSKQNRITIQSEKLDAVKITGVGNHLKLDGKAAPVTIIAPEGRKAIITHADTEFPVEITDTEYYDKNSGDPQSNQVIYDHIENYDLVVNGVEVNILNKDNILGDGTAVFHSETKTLVLNGYNAGAITSDRSFHILLADGSENTITATGDKEDAIHCDGDLSLTGSGNLTCHSLTARGIYAFSGLNIKDIGKLNITSKYVGMECQYKMDISGQGDIKIKSTDGSGIWSIYNGVFISGAGTVDIDCKGSGIYTANYAKVEVTGKRNLIIHAEEYALHIPSNVESTYLNTSGKIEIEAEIGIFAGKEFTLEGTGDIRIVAKKSGIFSYKDINIKGSGKLEIIANQESIDSMENVLIGGSREIIARSDAWSAIIAGSDVVITENAKVSAVSKSLYGVELRGAEGKLYLNGNGSPIFLASESARRSAVYNAETKAAEVAGTNMFFYNKITGAPDTNTVCYEHDESLVAIQQFVTRMYIQCLGREPDIMGLNGWVSQLSNRLMNGAQIAEAFVFSNEMLDKNLSDAEFVKILYRSMMGREADEAGLAGWVSQLQGGFISRSEVTKAFVESAEFTGICSEYEITRGDFVAVGDIERFVTRFYTICLGRPADQKGHWGWVVNLRDKKMNGAQIAEAFFFSEEFVGKNVSDEVYIATLYRTILGREADEAGLTGWVEQLQNNQMTRRDILAAFIESAEFTGLCAGYGIERGSL